MRPRIRRSLLARSLALVLPLIVPVPPALAAATINVTTTLDEYGTGSACSLREAVEAANTDAAFGGCPAGSGADTIALGAGTHALSTPGGGENANAAGDLDVTQSLSIQGAGATIIDGGQLDRVLHVDPGGSPVAVTVTIRDLAIQRGKMTDPADGGGIWAEDALELHGVTVAANETAGAGGGIKAEGPLTLTRSAVTQNVATQDGGGVNANSTLSVLESTIGGNTGDDGGGLDLKGATTITGSTISGNTANGLGSGPVKGDGGGIRNGTGALTVSNSTISGNRGSGDGGGIYAINPPGVTLTNVTVATNVADTDATANGDGGGISTTGAITMSNSIIARNMDATGEDPDCSGSPTSGGHNIFGIVSAGCTLSPATGDVVGTPATPLDPMLGALADNGGPTMTHALLPGSPAIDAADPAVAPPTDQRGVPRNPDIGAYELAFCEGVVANRVGTAGDDTLGGTPGADGVLAFGGNDTITTGEGDDAICAGDGDDTVDAGSGNDTVLGEGGNDAFAGGDGNDTLDGGDGNDTINGGDGDDTASGGAGDDTISMGAGDDTVDAGDGDDTVEASPGDDTALGGAGDDDLTSGKGKDVLKGGPGNDCVKGGPGNDRLSGQGGKDALSGEAGNDVLAGGGGKDVLKGGPGNDRLKGQGGSDTLNGGPGKKDRCRQGPGKGKLRRCER